MPDILEDAEAAIETLANGDFVQGPAFAALLRALVTEVEALREGDGLVERFGKSFLAMYHESKAQNYLAISLRDSNGVEFEVLLQRIGGETPAGRAMRLQDRWQKAIEYARSLPSDRQVTAWTVLDALVALETPNA